MVLFRPLFGILADDTSSYEISFNNLTEQMKAKGGARNVLMKSSNVLVKPLIYPFSWLNVEVTQQI